MAKQFCWSDLRPELLSLILSRLFSIRDRCVFKAVCKSWNLITPFRAPLSLLSLPPSVNSQYYDSPCLMICEGSNNHSWKLFHSVYNDFYYLDFPELMDAQIRFSMYGWLLMSRGDTLFFFNPFTKEKMELPTPISPFVSVSFTNPPTSEACLVFGVYSTSTAFSIDLGLLYFGHEIDWKHYSYMNFWEFYISNCPPLFYNDMFVLLDKSGNMCIFYPYKDKRQYRQYNNCRVPKIKEKIHQCYMAEVEGKICGVFVMKDGRICIEKLHLGKKVCCMTLEYEYTMNWVTLNSSEMMMRKKCLYVGPNGSFAETCVNGMANSIYFNKFYGDSGVVYSMSREKYHLIDGEYTSSDSSELTATGNNSIWIKPPRGTWIEPIGDDHDSDVWLSFLLSFFSVFLVYV